MGSTEDYNWDDLDVGRHYLNHSENFFDEKHLKHEKLKMEIPDLISTMENKENNLSKSCHQVSSKDDIINKFKTNLSLKTPNRNIKGQPLANIMHKPFSNQKKPIEGNVINPKFGALSAPSVYKYAQVYEKKKQENMRRQLEEERKNRIFHSKPAPKVKKGDEYKMKIFDEKAIRRQVTLPVTPAVLKKSKEAVEKWNEKKKEILQQNNPQKFTSREPRVLHEKPFLPRKAGQVVKPVPFNLHVEKRLEERKMFNLNVKKSFDEKMKQEEEEKKRKDHEEIRELRKCTLFKARPNPFK